MRIALVALTLLLFYGVGICAGSPQTPLLNQNKVSDTKGKGYQNQATDSTQNINLPLRVQIVPPPENDPERNTYKAEQSQKTRMDWTTIGIGITTAIILFFQLIVFGRQASRLSDTIKCTQKAERPYIFAEPVGYSMLKGDELAKWKCDYIVKNHGKTPAIIISKVVYIWLIADGDYPPYEIIQGKDIPEGGGVIGSGDHRPFICGPKKIDITVAQNIENGLEIGKLFCVGRIDYKDIFGEKHFTEFEWVFKNDTINPKGFYLTPNEKRNRYT